MIANNTETSLSPNPNISESDNQNPTTSSRTSIAGKI